MAPDHSEDRPEHWKPGGRPSYRDRRDRRPYSTRDYYDSRYRGGRSHRGHSSHDPWHPGDDERSKRPKSVQKFIIDGQRPAGAMRHGQQAAEDPTYVLCLSNLSMCATEEDLRDVLGRRVSKDHRIRFVMSRGRARCLVSFESLEEAMNAHDVLRNETINGHTVQVQYYYH